VIGCDSRSQGGVGRSDAMLLFSVNDKTEKIHMTSLMRDSYVAIPGKGNNRLNAAYALGGGSLLLDTVEANFEVPVEKYVAFDFYSFVDIVDCMGGVEINVSEEEIPVLNGYVKELNRLNGRPEGTYYVTESGLQHLNGTQALGYSRIRYVGNADFERTGRQRTVITKVFEKAKNLSLLEMNELLNTFLPMIKTNLTQEEILSLALKALDYLQYDLDSHRLPVDGSYQFMQINGMSVLGIDLEQNRQALKEFCIVCGKELTRDEIGLHKKLVNRGATAFKCKPCLAAFFRITEEQCDEMIAHFRETGCTLFS
jgi:LCP family protein required for cell wall assembly